MPEAPWRPDEDRCFDPDPTQRKLARELYQGIAHLPIVSPHGHVDPRLFADEHASFGTPADLFIIPDHYVFRMLYSQGVSLEQLGVRRRDGAVVESDHRKIWQIFGDRVRSIVPLFDTEIQGPVMLRKLADRLFV